MEGSLSLSRKNTKERDSSISVGMTNITQNRWIKKLTNEDLNSFYFTKMKMPDFVVSANNTPSLDVVVNSCHFCPIHR